MSKYYVYFDYSALSVLQLAISIVIAGAMGLLVAKTSFTDTKLSADLYTRDMPIKVKYSRIILISVITLWFGLLSFGLYRSVSAPASWWRLITPAHAPAPRSDATIAYDSDRGRAVLFGGYDTWSGSTRYKNDTWEWDSKDWVQRIVDLQPSPRAYTSMAYDEINKTIILYGGKSKDGYLSDTWLWDGEVWTEAHPSTPPPARASHQLLYDPQHQKVVLYGGYDGNYLHDGWEWDGKEWQTIQFETFSPEACCFLMFYDPAFDRIVVYISWNGTWYWNGVNWGKPVLDMDPGIFNLPVAYDTQNKSAVIFLGYKDKLFIHETWIYKNMNWRKLDILFEPAMRVGQATFYDPVRKKVIIFGGYDKKDYLNDTWELVISDDK